MGSDSNLNLIIGERIREQRKSKRITREALAEQIDVSSRFLASLEWGQVGASVSTLRKICLVLDINADYLLDITKNNDSFDEIKTMLSRLSEENLNDITEIVTTFCNAVKRSQKEQ